MKEPDKKSSDIEECRQKIFALLSEYGCQLISQDEWHGVLIRDNHTDETMSMSRRP